MKQLVRIIIVILSALTGISLESMVSGPIIREEVFASGYINRQAYCWTTNSAAYIPGGIALNYPVGLFLAAPSVVVQADVPAPVADTAFVATISGNSTVDVTVTVYKISSVAGVPTGMVEATAGDNVTVYLYAVGPQ